MQNTSQKLISGFYCPLLQSFIKVLGVTTKIFRKKGIKSALQAVRKGTAQQGAI